MQEIDRKILTQLTKNSRQSYHQLAKKLKVSAATVMAHVKGMESDGIIRKYTTLLDYELLGYDLHVMIDLRISKGKLLMVERKIASHPNVVAVYDTTGHFDATLLAMFRNRRTLDRFLKLIQGYDFVERTETKMVLNTIKEDSVGRL